MSELILSNEDRYYLRTNLELEPYFEDDPEAQALFAVESNETHVNSPVWNRDQAVGWIRSRADSLGLLVKVVVRPRHAAATYVGRGGGCIILPDDFTSSLYRPLRRG